MLWQNTTIYAQYPVRFLSGATIAGERTLWGQVERRNFYLSEAGIDKTSAIPLGNLPPGTILMPQKSGGMASRGTLAGTGVISSMNLAGGYPASASLAGTGSIASAALGLVASAVATLAGGGTLTADIVGKLEAVAALSGSGNISSALGALASLVCSIAGIGAIDADIHALGELSADITPFTELSPQSLASALLNSMASAYNDPGTVGAAINAAGSAGDPWITYLPGSYVSGQAGFIVGTNLDKKISDVDVVATGSAMNKRADSCTVNVGNVLSGTYLNTYDLDSTRHVIEPVGGVIDVVYEFQLGIDNIGVSITEIGRIDGNKSGLIQAYRWTDETYYTIGTISGKSSDTTDTGVLFFNNTGTETNQGVVRIRFYATGLSLSNLLMIDMLWVSYAAVNDFDSISIISKILRNKAVTNPETGVMTIYDDDGVTPFLVAQLYENASGTQSYRGQGVERRERLE